MKIRIAIQSAVLAVAGFGTGVSAARPASEIHSADAVMEFCGKLYPHHPRCRTLAAREAPAKKKIASIQSLKSLSSPSGFAPLEDGLFEEIAEGKTAPELKSQSAEMDTGDGDRTVRDVTCPKKPHKDYECGRRNTRIASLDGASSEGAPVRVSSRSAEMDSGNGRNLNGSNRPGMP